MVLSSARKIKRELGFVGMWATLGVIAAACDSSPSKPADETSASSESTNGESSQSTTTSSSTNTSQSASDSHTDTSVDALCEYDGNWQPLWQFCLYSAALTGEVGKVLAEIRGVTTSIQNDVLGNLDGARVCSGVADPDITMMRRYKIVDDNDVIHLLDVPMHSTSPGGVDLPWQVDEAIDIDLSFIPPDWGMGTAILITRDSNQALNFLYASGSSFSEPIVPEFAIARGAASCFGSHMCFDRWTGHPLEFTFSDGMKAVVPGGKMVSAEGYSLVHGKTVREASPSTCTDISLASTTFLVVREP